MRKEQDAYPHPLLTIDELANHFEISHGSAYDIIHNRLGFRKVCASWVSKQLTEEQKNNRGHLSTPTGLLC